MYVCMYVCMYVNQDCVCRNLVVGQTGRHADRFNSNWPPQAESHVLTSLHVRPSISRVVIINRTRKRAMELKHSLEAGWESNQAQQVEVIALSTSEDPASTVDTYLKEADVVCCCTGSAAPLFDGSLLSPGTHVNAVGSYEPHTTELDANTVRRSAIVLDTQGAAPVGDIALYVADGTISHETHVAGTLGEMLVRREEGQELLLGTTHNDKELTLFKSVGTAVQDVVTADVAYESCKAAGLGQQVKL
jgi:ornithine cyclodeaminase/alanine dehydrogenase-like protein (mu-crystallin family)